jgi:hypothetical protein
LATGLSTALTKDGQTTATARIPFAQGITSTLVTDSSSTSTGSIITAGGVGIAKNLYVGVNANIAGTLNVTGSTTLTNPVINNIKMGYSTTATAAGSTTLTVSSNYRQFFTGTLAQTIVLPVTSTLVTGMAFEIENNSTGLLTVNSSGGNLVGTIPAGVCAHAVCIGTTLTTAADWDWDYISTTTITGTGANVLGTSPTITTPTISSLSSAAATALTLQSAGTTAITVDTSQNVGIGTSSPSYKVDVGSFSTGTMQTIRVAATTDTQLRLMEADDSYGFSFRNVAGSGLNILRHNANATGTTALFINRGDGNVGIGVTPSNANGGVLQLKSGITFPATQVAATDANTLDDYEEGTFTPTIIGLTSAGTGTYSNQTGSYVKVGQIVSIYIRLDWSAHTGTGFMGFGGLPFTTAGTYTNGAAVNGMAGLTVAALCYVSANVTSSATTGIFLAIPVGGGSDSQVSMDTAGILIFTITYRASA